MEVNYGVLFNLGGNIMWKNTIKKKIFDETPEEMTDFMNVSPRMEEAGEKRKGSKDSLEMPDKVTYESSSIRKKLKAIGEYRDSLVGKTFTAKENMILQQLIMDLVNEYN
tara:strand:- start:414 stop:743 length:330 start_codon:yes stop_codon:yes gene_type:complete